MFSARGQFDGCCAAKRWRIMILRSGGYANDYRFRVTADMNPVFFTLARFRKAIQRRADRHSHRTGATDARTRRSFRVGGKCESSGRPKKLHNFGEKWQSIASGFCKLTERAETLLALGVTGHQLDLFIAGTVGFYYARRVTRNRHVHG